MYVADPERSVCYLVWWIFKKARQKAGYWEIGGGKEDRTPDLCNAIAALSQLSYTPTYKRNVLYYAQKK